MNVLSAAIVGAALILVGLMNRYEISATPYGDGSRIYRLDRFTGEICTRATQSADWACYLGPKN
jgi:hypothetical protein